MICTRHSYGCLQQYLSKKSIQRYPIIMNEADYDFILDEIGRRKKNYFEINVSVNIDK